MGDINSELQQGRLLYDEVDSIYHRIVHKIKSCGYIYFCSSRADGTKMSLPTRYLLSKVISRLEEGSLKFSEKDILKPSLDLESRSKKDKEVASKRWKKIESLVEGDQMMNLEGRYALIEKAAATEPIVSVVSLLNWIKSYFIGGMTEIALTPKYSQCGAPGEDRCYKRKTTDARIEIIRLGYKEFCKKGSSMAHALKLTNDKYYNCEVHGPNRIEYQEFRRYAAKLFPSHFERKKWKYGTKYARSNNRLLGGRANDIANGPGTLFQIDWTSLDIDVVHSINRNKSIGRPILYLVVDTYSRMITGILITLKHASFQTCCRALYNAAIDKVKFAKQFGEEISSTDWECSSVPQNAVADGGSDVLNHKTDSIGKGFFKMGIATTESYRGDLKAIVERLNRTLKTYLSDSLDGFGQAQNKFKRRKGVDTRKEACLTMKELYRIVIKLVIDYNHTTIRTYPKTEQLVADDTMLIPAQIWRHAMENGYGYVKRVDPEVLWLSLLDVQSRIPDRDGFQINRDQFVPENKKDFDCLENLINAPGGAGAQRITYNPDNYLEKYWIHKGQFIPLRPLGYHDPKFQTEDEACASMESYNEKVTNQENEENKRKAETVACITAIKKEAKRNRPGKNANIKDRKKYKEDEQKNETRTQGVPTLPEHSQDADMTVGCVLEDLNEEIYDDLFEKLDADF